MVPKPRIFESAPGARPEPGVSDIVGRFRAGRMMGRTPVALDTWRVTTGDRAVAAAVTAALGGSVEEWDTQGEDNLEVLTDADSVRVVVTGADAIESDLKLWGIGGVIIHHCDGAEFLTDDRKGEPCGCPELLADRKEEAKAGRGPKPDTSITFRLLDVPCLGRFQMRSGSWDLLRVLHEYVSDLDGVGGPAMCALTLETVTFVPKGGPMGGKIVSYKKPTLKVDGPYEGTSEPA
ncbi:hypothetical protein [Actinomadura welshii]|uniref:recombination directionality factor n=1 Tax=Actinomadura welshii TaxID=3103817 RepID=UPI0003ACF6C3|nr:hypothetical protein [Actinomadura madurae]